jgi:hypothetical protein
LKKGYV